MTGGFLQLGEGLACEVSAHLLTHLHTHTYINLRIHLRTHTPTSAHTHTPMCTYTAPGAYIHPGSSRSSHLALRSLFLRHLQPSVSQGR